MRTFTGAFQTILDNDVAALCRVVEIHRRTKSTLYLAEGQEDIVFGGNTYIAGLGLESSAVQISGSLNEQTMDLKMLVNASGVTLEDVQAGQFDEQIAIVSIIDRNTPDVGSMILFNGYMGESNQTNDGYVFITLEGRMTRPRYLAGEVYSGTCRNDLGDSVCSVNIETLARNFTIAALTNQQNFTTGLTQATDYFTGGLVKFTSGPLTDYVIECRKYANASGRVHLWLPPPGILTVGTTGRIYPGCKKTVKVCRDKFNNVRNFRGEPYLPPRNVVPPSGQTAGKK